ncbi:MAG: hypothetical protein E7372_01570 [Clostridiales bacterium]|nr:hypothetical protein [Clostridiales bacterium]
MKCGYYLNINGKYGMGAYAQPDYPTMQDLLDSMDRLGIWQTVAYHLNARDLHPVFGNKFLLEDIEKTPDAKKRIIPAFCANPAMLVGKGEMEALEKCLNKGVGGCIIIFPVTNRFRLVEYRPVFERIRKYQPVILIDITEMTANDVEDLAHIAPEFPDLNFVIKEVMWWQYSRVLDLMRRTKNVYCDISWLHTRDAIKILCEQTDYSRVVFGVGYRSHGGAAIGGLAWANIPQKKKDQIAWDNFVSLLPKNTKKHALRNKKKVQDKIDNRFWKEFIVGKPLSDVLVIDAHTHIGPFTRSWYLLENGIEDQVATFKKEMKAFGIDKMLSQPETALFGTPIEGNKMVEIKIDDKEHFRGNLVVNPIYSELYTEEVLDSFFKGGYFCGFKVAPQYLGVNVDDKRFFKMYEYANKHSMHILFHSFDDGDCGTPEKIAKMAEKYPNANFIIGHSGGGTRGRKQAEQFAKDSRYNNCYFEFCGSFTTDVRWEDSLKHIDYHRVVFGTDTVVHDIAWELARLLSLDIPEEQIEAILGNNMQSVLDKTVLPE